MNTGKSSKKSTKKPGTTSTGSKRKASKVIDFTPAHNKQKITFVVKGHVFELSIPEVFVLNHVMLDAMQKGETMVALYTDFNKYQVGWVYGPIATNI